MARQRVKRPVRCRPIHTAWLLPTAWLFCRLSPLARWRLFRCWFLAPNPPVPTSGTFRTSPKTVVPGQRMPISGALWLARLGLSCCLHVCNRATSEVIHVQCSASDWSAPPLLGPVLVIGLGPRVRSRAANNRAASSRAVSSRAVSSSAVTVIGDQASAFFYQGSDRWYAGNFL